MNFEELCLDPRIFRAVTEMGFEQASPIQAKAIPVAGLVISGAVGFAATEAVGRAAIEYFEAGGSAAGVANVAKRAAGEAADAVQKAAATPAGKGIISAAKKGAAGAASLIAGKVRRR